jgi:predicted PurR-regulated permease PerM
MPPEKSGHETSAFERRVLLVIGTFLPILIIIALFWFLADILLVIFAAILLAILLSSLTDFTARWLHLPRTVSLFTVIGFFLLLAGVTAWQLAPRLIEEFQQLFENVAASLRQLQLQLQSRTWGQALLRQIPDGGELMSGLGNILAKTPGVISRTIGIIGSFFLFLVLGVYLAANPGLYQRGIIRLLPISRRPRGKEILDEIASILRWWLIGKVAEMAVIGTLTALGLWLIGIPLAFILGVIAGLLNFIPYLGPILSFIPPLLLAIGQGPTAVLWVVLLYTTIQTLESYFLTPQIEKRSILLPPAVILTAQVAMGVLMGALGLVLADPLVAVISILIQTVYLEDILGDREAVPGSER